MTVRIEEVVTEAVPDTVPPGPAPGAATGAGDRSPLDLNLLDYEKARRRQRQVRLWAD